MNSAPCCLDAGCMQAPRTKDPDSRARKDIRTEEKSRHWLHGVLAIEYSLQPDVQTADKSCSPHASCWHPAANTQTPTRGNVQMSRPQTSLVLHMLHVGIQHQTPIFQPEELSRCPDHRQVLFSTCFMWYPAPNTQTPARGDVQTADKSPVIEYKLQPEEMSRQQTTTSALPRLVCWSLFI